MSAAGASHRVKLQPAFVLHHRPYRDTSRILELFTRDFGRLSVFARGARGGAKSAGSLASVLQPFHRILVSFNARGEAGQLVGAEFDGAIRDWPAARSLSGFYLSELLMRLFERHDAHPEVFDLYAATLENLRDLAFDEAAVLRVFEKRLLSLLGYGVTLDREAHSGVPVNSAAMYRYLAESGVTRIDGVAEGDALFSGASLLALHGETLTGAEVKADARRLLRAALDRCLAGRAMRTREVLSELRRMRGTT